MDLKNKKNWKDEGRIDVWACSRPWEQTERNPLIVLEATVAAEWVDAGPHEGPSGWKW